jgi:transcriptional regulator with XRE-family HTH domain
VVLEMAGRFLMGPDCQQVDREIEAHIACATRRALSSISRPSITVDSGTVGQIVKCYSRLKEASYGYDTHKGSPETAKPEGQSNNPGSYARDSKVIHTRRIDIVFGHTCAEGESNMIIGERLRAVREQKQLSQGDIEKRTGLLRSYVSRVENGHTVPAIETLEKLARALEIPLYQLFYDREEPPKIPNLPKRSKADDIAWGSTRKEARTLGHFRRLLGRIGAGDRKLLLYMAQHMARSRRAKA